MVRRDGRCRVSKLIKLLAFVNAVAVLVIGAARLDRPPGFWGVHAGWVIGALMITALIPAVQVAIRERGEKGRRAAVERERKIEAFLAASLIHVARRAGADWETTGVQAFLIRRGWRRSQQVRAAKMRLGPVPSSGIIWTEGKGIIGRCWATRAPVCADLESHFAPYLGSSRTEWEALPAETRFGLTYEDFRRLAGKYGIVAAVPIIDARDTYVGCVTADTPPLNGKPGTLQLDEVLKSLASTAQLVRHVL
jgi:hypothetical protein